MDDILRLQYRSVAATRERQKMKYMYHFNAVELNHYGEPPAWIAYHTAIARFGTDVVRGRVSIIVKIPSSIIRPQYGGFRE